jgi:flavoprotein
MSDPILGVRLHSLHKSRLLNNLANVLVDKGVAGEAKEKVRESVGEHDLPEGKVQAVGKKKKRTCRCCQQLEGHILSARS